MFELLDPGTVLLKILVGCAAGIFQTLLYVMENMDKQTLHYGDHFEKQTLQY